MTLRWSETAWADYQYWHQVDPAVLFKINDLLRNVLWSPYQGKGHPLPLKGGFEGWWSRRICGDHRLVYRVVGTEPAQHIEIVQCRYRV